LIIFPIFNIQSTSLLCRLKITYLFPRYEWLCLRVTYTCVCVCVCVCMCVCVCVCRDMRFFKHYTTHIYKFIILCLYAICAIYRQCLNAIYAIYGQCLDKQRGQVVAHVPEPRALVVILVMLYTPTLWCTDTSWYA
jgi:hypothetical protein